MARTKEQASEDTARHVAFVLSNTGGQHRDEVRVTEMATAAAEQVWAHIGGLLRDRVPDDVPDDLFWVAKSAALRISKGMVDTGSMLVRAGEVVREMEYRPWTGFMLTERMILDRYRTVVK